MPEEMLTMSHQELDRLEIVRAISRRQMTQKEAARRLQLSVRQVKRLVRRYREEKAVGLISRHRGKRPNNAIPAAVRGEAVSLLKQHYADFSPTFAHEKLTEHHGLPFSVETLRQWMMAEGLWAAKTRKAARIHPSRSRRPCCGELVQIDGSPHDWFEGRAPQCTLIVFIDDATSRLLALRFAPAETTQAYMDTLADYLKRLGRPVSLYSDRHSIFRINHADHAGEITQFGRALKTLDIELIHAHTPQAKGRVERANQTLQDRLVKEMRLRRIDSIEQAHGFLPTFIDDYNRRFGVESANPNNAHRPVLHTLAELALILSHQETRKLSKNLAFYYQNTLYQLQGCGNGYRLRGATVTVCQAGDGTVTVLYDGKVLPHHTLAQGGKPTPVVDEKSIHLQVEQAKANQDRHSNYKPAPDHPWRRPLKNRPQPPRTTP